jgi:hypothetical protein
LTQTQGAFSVASLLVVGGIEWKCSTKEIVMKLVELGFASVETKGGFPECIKLDSAAGKTGTRYAGSASVEVSG